MAVNTNGAALRWREKYEKIVKVLQKEFKETVLKAQKVAEENTASYQELIQNLKEELCRKDERIQELEAQLKQEPGSTRKRSQSESETTSTPKKPALSPIGDDSTNGDQQKLELFQALTCLTVSVMEDGRGFKCRMDEGEMSGHEFVIRYKREEDEYLYEPTNPAHCLSGSNPLLQSMAFPDYMLPKFLMSLLGRTYTTPNDDQQFIKIDLSSSEDD